MPRVLRARAWASIYSFLHEDKVMEKNTSKRILIVVTVFYIFVSILAVAILSLSGSIFAKRGETNLAEYFSGLFGNDEEAVEEAINETSPEDKLQGLDALDISEPQSVAMTDPLPEPEPEPEPAPVEETAVSSDMVSDDDTVSSDDVEEEEEHYYSFKSNNTDTKLRMREEPDEKSRIVYELKPGTTGYVIEIDDEWSEVCAYGNRGYCANEFLTMTEISKDEYDELVKQTDEAKEKKQSTDNTNTLPAVDPAALNAAGAAPVPVPDANAAGTADASPSEDP